MKHRFINTTAATSLTLLSGGFIAVASYETVLGIALFELGVGAVEHFALAGIWLYAGWKAWSLAFRVVDRGYVRWRLY